MYPTLSDFFYDWFGVYLPLPVKTFGAFMALGFLLGALWLRREFLRLEKLGILSPSLETVEVGKPATPLELLLNAIFGFVLGYKLLFALSNWRNFSQHPENYLISTDGSLLGGLAMAALFAWLFYRERKQQQLPIPEKKAVSIYPHERVSEIIIIAAIFGILGSKLFTWIEDIDAFLSDPIGALFSFSGLTFYGGLICAAFAVSYYGYRKQIPVARLADTAAPALLIGYGVGRLGCHFAGDGDWGIPNLAPKPFAALPDWLWAYTYPNNVLNEGIPLDPCFNLSGYCHVLPEPVYPTSVYEFMMAMSILLLLALLRKRLTHLPGLLFGIYFLLNGVERFSIETIRINEHYTVLGTSLSQAQIIALGLVAVGIGIIVFTATRLPQYPPNKS